MRFRILELAAAAAVTTVAAMGGLIAGSDRALAQAKTIAIDGSSTVFPVTEAIAEEFQKSTKGAVRVTVGISGTGGGFKKFCRGETDMSNGSRPILKAEIDQCKAAGIEFYELPIAFDALTVVVHPQNKILSCITIADLKKMWEPAAQGKVTKWKDVESELAGPASEALRPGRRLRHLRLFHRSRHGQGQVEPRRLHRQRG